MTGVVSPQKWAIDISQLLNTVFGRDHFPIDVEQIALEFTKQRFPDDPISLVAGDALHGFDGALVRAPSGKKGWGIIYNKAIASRGRINFTLAHELGHYLVHRLSYPNGFQCGEQDVVRWDSEYGQLEHQANAFASYLLMPLDDFRRQINSRDPANLEILGHCAKRYNVSLIAATRKWLEYTERRAVMVISRDGFILWARSSEKALRTGAYFRTSGNPIAIPTNSLAARGRIEGSEDSGIELSAGTWFKDESCCEVAIVSEQYDFTISLLLLPNESANQLRFNRVSDDDTDDREDLLARIQRNHGLKS